MMHGIRVLTLLTIAAASQKSSQAVQPPSAKDHAGWVVQVLMRMQTIKPGMTREKLLTVFTTEGGLSTGLRRTYVSKDCPYFKVDVEFQAVGRPGRDESGRVTMIEGAQDIILKISQPYLQFSILD
jgi:hypothetical protein